MAIPFDGLLTAADEGAKAVELKDVYLTPPTKLYQENQKMLTDMGINKERVIQFLGSPVISPPINLSSSGPWPAWVSRRDSRVSYRRRVGRGPGALSRVPAEYGNAQGSPRSGAPHYCPARFRRLSRRHHGRQAPGGSRLSGSRDLESTGLRVCRRCRSSKWLRDAPRSTSSPRERSAPAPSRNWHGNIQVIPSLSRYSFTKANPVVPAR